MCVCQLCGNYSLYVLITWLPYYLVRDRQFSMPRMARAGALVFLASAAAALIFGRLSDHWIAAGHKPTAVRKSLAALSQVGVGVFILASALVPTSLVVVMLALVGAGIGIGFCNLWSITQTLAGPRNTGRWVGIQNFVGNFAGAIAPALTGFLIDRTGSFYWPFLVTAMFAGIGVISWLLLVGPVEAVVWDNSAQPGDAMRRPAAHASRLP
jgi:MFS family permease